MSSRVEVINEHVKNSDLNTRIDVQRNINMNAVANNPAADYLGSEGVSALTVNLDHVAESRST